MRDRMRCPVPLTGRPATGWERSGCSRLFVEPRDFGGHASDLLSQSAELAFAVGQLQPSRTRMLQALQEEMPLFVRRSTE